MRIDERVISDGEIHVRAMRIEATAEAAAGFAGLLSEDERERAARFRFEHLRYSFTCARGALRVLLGGYLGIAAAAVEFGYGSNGKPFLKSGDSIRFNASHSGDWAVFAFASGCDVGIDVEKVRPLPDMADIARNYFCRAEWEALMSLPAEEREAAFFRCWTRKEAYIKATGEGLSAPLDAFQVTLDADAPARFLHIGHDESAAAEWTLEDLRVAPGYAAALACRGTQRRISIQAVA